MQILLAVGALKCLFVVIYIFGNVTQCLNQNNLCFQDSSGKMLQDGFSTQSIQHVWKNILALSRITRTILNMFTDLLTVSWWREGSQPSPLPAAAFQSHDAGLPHLLS